MPLTNNSDGCPACGRDVKPTWNYCPQCGRTLRAKPFPPMVPPSKGGKKSPFR